MKRNPLPVEVVVSARSSDGPMTTRPARTVKKTKSKCHVCEGVGSIGILKRQQVTSSVILVGSKPCPICNDK